VTSLVETRDHSHIAEIRTAIQSAGITCVEA